MIPRPDDWMTTHPLIQNRCQESNPALRSTWGGSRGPTTATQPVQRRASWVPMMPTAPPAPPQPSDGTTPWHLSGMCGSSSYLGGSRRHRSQPHLPGFQKLKKHYDYVYGNLQQHNSFGPSTSRGIGSIPETGPRTEHRDTGSLEHHAPLQQQPPASRLLQHQSVVVDTRPAQHQATSDATGYNMLSRPQSPATRAGGHHHNGARPPNIDLLPMNIMRSVSSSGTQTMNPASCS
jgi:hypothetical protein